MHIILWHNFNYAPHLEEGKKKKRSNRNAIILIRGADRVATGHINIPSWFVSILKFGRTLRIQSPGPVDVCATFNFRQRIYASVRFITCACMF